MKKEKKICPICKKRIESYSANSSLMPHIVAMAKQEAYIEMMDLFHYHKKNFKNVSRIVLLRQMPHFNHLRKLYKQ